jgi:hypothetical protein
MEPKNYREWLEGSGEARMMMNFLNEASNSHAPVVYRRFLAI